MTGTQISDGLPDGSGPKRYFKFMGNPRWYMWGFVVIFAILASYVFLALEHGYWPFHVEPDFRYLGGSRDKKACTMEAKLCPDGSYVGRTGPDCEFAPCPSK